MTVEGSENLETEGDMQKKHLRILKKQEELLKETLKKIDIVVCTALIPGKKAPLIIKKDMIDVMSSGLLYMIWQLHKVETLSLQRLIKL